MVRLMQNELCIQKVKTADRMKQNHFHFQMELPDWLLFHCAILESWLTGLYQTLIVIPNFVGMTNKDAVQLACPCSLISITYLFHFFKKDSQYIFIRT